MENFTLTTSTGTAVFSGTELVVTSADGSTTTTFTVPAETTVTATDTGITVTHSDGTTADFVPAA